jgi:hypothetical protein
MLPDRMKLETEERDYVTVQGVGWEIVDWDDK